MQGKTHLISGMTGGLLVGTFYNCKPLDMALAVGVGGLAGLIPDWLQINIPNVKQVKGLFGHRGFSHWAWVPLAGAYILSLSLQNWLVFAFLAGWGVHLTLDAFSNGISAFWPFGRIRLGRIKTGGKTDTLIGAFFLILFIAMLYIIYIRGGMAMRIESIGGYILATASVDLNNLDFIPDPELDGKPIRLMDAHRKYDVPEGTIWNWANSGLVRVIDRGPKLLVIDEASVAKAVAIFKYARQFVSARKAAWILKHALS